MDSIKQAWSDSKGAPDTADKAVDKGAEGGKSAEQQAQEDTYDAPTDWAHEEREAFRAYQPEVRKFALGKIRSVDEGWKAKTAEYEKFQGTYKPFDEFFKTREQQLAAIGAKPFDAVQQLFALNDRASKDPGEFAKWFIQSRGLDPAKLFQLQQQAAQADAGGYVDPEVQALKNEIAQLKQGFQETQAQVQQRQQREAAQRDAEWANQVTDFRNAKAADGKSPKHPYINDVEGHMAALLKAKQAKDLADAYDQAIYANPTVRAKVLADAKASERREAEKAEREHAEKAKKAAATVTSSGSRSEGSPNKTEKGESVMDSIKRARRDLAKDAA